MDVLSATGFLNYYGRVTDSRNIEVKPVMFRKGNTKLALYGISNLRDERMKHTFKHGRAKFLRPSVQTNEFFNLLAVHQNHHAHTKRGVFPEEYIPDYIDAVVWGHEHECLIDPKINVRKGFSVIQPGSSVATSLIEGEAVPKHVAIMSVTGKTFTMENIRLKTVRPFAIETVELSRSPIKPGVDNRTQVTRWLEKRVKDLIQRAVNEWEEVNRTPGFDNNGEDKTGCPLPLIRLKVEYSGDYQVENPTRFSNRFVGQVANVDDVIHYFRRKVSSSNGKGQNISRTDITINKTKDENGLEMIQVEELIEEFLKTDEMSLLHGRALSTAINNLVTKEDKAAIKQFFEKSLEVQSKVLVGMGVEDVQSIIAALEKTKINTQESLKEIADEQTPSSTARYHSSDSLEPESLRTGSKAKTDLATESTQRQRAVPVKTTGRGRNTRTKVSTNYEDDENDDDLDEGNILPKTSRLSTRTRKPTSQPVIRVVSDSDEPLDIDDDKDDDEEGEEEEEDPEVIISDYDEPAPTPPPRRTTGRSTRARPGLSAARRQAPKSSTTSNQVISRPPQVRKPTPIQAERPSQRASSRMAAAAVSSCVSPYHSQMLPLTRFLE
ncbi:MRX complex nuclease subunit [Sugiyamaella lignohabitans]|uniref:MRX complex nuclease subunit n=1 Tax=Sugiyamaella lignohabitans TaxID=796027 RepID=A0A167E121_9ASCO|nr:MRX complex nuclease subunit [Sugiyamaella lignohabitans]ANB13523.1 MRX complex nuclease subunit [Sugiyamaella lignohabitans]